MTVEKKVYGGLVIKNIKCDAPFARMTCTMKDARVHLTYDIIADNFRVHIQMPCGGVVMMKESYATKRAALRATDRFLTKE